MALWTAWLAAVTQLRNASSNRRNFMWFVVVLAGMSIRKDLLGVTSIVRVLGLNENCYHSSFKFFCNYLILKGLNKMLSFKKKSIISIFSINFRKKLETRVTSILLNLYKTTDREAHTVIDTS